MTLPRRKGKTPLSHQAIEPGKCRIAGCGQPNATGRRRLCADCAAKMVADVGGRKSARRCRMIVGGQRCTRPIAAPRRAGLCTVCSPSYREKHSLENVALDAAAQGKDPAKALADAGATQPKALAKAIAQRPDFQVRLAELMKRAEIDEADGLRAIGRALKAKKRVKLKTGDELLTEADDHEMQFEAGKFMVGIQGLAGAADGKGAPAGATINLHIGAHIPEHKPLDLKAEVIEVGDVEDED